MQWLRIGMLGLFFSTGIVAPVAQASDFLVGGQKHEYKVVLRGDGRAIVVGKMTVPNMGDGVLANMSVDLGIRDAVSMSAYQVLVEQECSKYTVAGDIRTCTKYKDIASRDITNAPYEKVTIMKSGSKAGTTYALSLPRPVEPGMTAIILLAYSSQEYTSERLGLFSYSFSTPTVEENIESMTVTVQTDSDAYIQGEGSVVQYSNDLPELLSSGDDSLSADFALTTMTSQRGNTIRQTATNLFAGETFTVTGRYSAYWCRMHVGAIGATLLILGVFIAYVVLQKKRAQKGNTPSALHALRIPVQVTPLMNGFFTAVLLNIWTAMVTYGLASSFIFGRVSGLEGGIAMAMIGMIVVMVYVLCGFGPAVLLGSKKGWKAGVMTFVATIVWLIIGVALVALFS